MNYTALSCRPSLYEVYVYMDKDGEAFRLVYGQTEGTVMKPNKW